MFTYITFSAGFFADPLKLPLGRALSWLAAAPFLVQVNGPLTGWGTTTPIGGT